ncbi:MAG: AAA family ATPase [Alphaproteobacteria bacterium]
MSSTEFQMAHELAAEDAIEPATPTLDARPVPRITVQAFCESPDLIDIIEGAAADRRLARAHVKVHGGGVAAAAEFYRESATPNLVLVEAMLEMPELEDQLDRLADVTDPGTKVVVIGSINDVALYRDLIKRGVSEYLVAPVDVAGVIRTISGLFVEEQAGPIGRTIAFVGAKGGVGSSMVAHNTAWSIARKFENEVVVMDLDLAFGTAGLDYNQDPAQGIAEAVNAPDRLDDNFFDRLLARCSDNLSLLAAPATLDHAYDFGELAFEPVIDIAQSGVPIVILDVPHVWTGWARKTLLSADEVVITVEPDLANLRNAKNLMDLLRQQRLNDAPPRLVVNKIGLAKRPEISVNDLAQALGIEPLVSIPFDGQLFGTAANNGQMIAEVDVKSTASEVFDRLAATVTGREEIKGAQRGFLAPLLKRLRGRKSG